MKIYLLTFLSFSTIGFAKVNLGAPAMEKRMLNFQLEKSTKHICHEDSEVSSHHPSKVNTDYFTAKVSCSYKCKNQVLKSNSTTMDFIPKDYGLYKGDGTSSEKIIWRSLGLTLNTWADEQCLNIALKECKKIDQLETIKMDRVESGDWEMTQKISCSNQTIVKSPFDESLKIKNIGRTAFIPKEEFFYGTPQSEIKNSVNKLSEFIPLNTNKEELEKLIDKKDCLKPIKIKACFGDCVFETQNNNQWVETINTPGPLGTDDYSICGDNFSKKIDPKLQSKDYIQLKCEKYVWEVIQAIDMSGASCAALRLDTDCSALYKI